MEARRRKRDISTVPALSGNDALIQKEPVHKTKKAALSLKRAMESLKPHDHACLIYEKKSEQFAAIVPYLKAGLDRGERCIYIADENTAAEVKKALGKVMDVDKAAEGGALSIIGKQDAYLRDGYFDPDRMMSLLKENYIQAKSEGFSALRVTGEMTWALGDEPGVDRLLEYESKLNEFFPEYDALAMCQYNARRFHPDILADVIRTHPLVIYGSMVCRNYYYVPPDEFLREDRPGSEVKRLLDNIVQTEFRERALREANASLKARERQQEAVAALGQRALSGTELQDLLETAVKLAAEVLDVELCKVLELLPDRKEFMLRAGVGWKEGLVGKGTVGAGRDSQAGYTLVSSAPVVVEDLRTEKRFSGPRLLHDHGVISGASVIIQNGKDRPFGVLGAHSSRVRAFTSDDVNFLQAVANVLAEAIRRKKAEEKISRLNILYSVLSSVNQMIIRVRDRNELFDQACRIVTEQGLFQFAWIGLVDGETQEVVPVAKGGAEDGFLDRIRVTIKDEPEGRGPAGTAVREGRHVCIGNIKDDPEMQPWKDEALRRGFRACGAFPIKLGRKVVGAYIVYSSAPAYFAEEEIGLLQELADDISFALQYMQEAEALKKKTHALDQRLKELKCLYEVSDMLSRSGVPLPKALQDSAQAIPAAMQHPEVACACIEFNGKKYCAPNCREGGQRLLSEIKVQGKPAGSLAICYLERMPEEDGSPFTKEEANLAGELARRIGQEVENRGAEEALVESEGKFRTLVEGSLVGVYILQDGKVNYANPKLAEIFGYGKEEIIGKGVIEMIVPEDRRHCLKRMMEILSGASADNRHLFRAYRKNGAIIDMEVLGSKTVYNGKPAIIGTLQDISETRKYEEGLRHEIAVSSALLDASRITSAAMNWDDLTEKVVELLNSFVPNSGISIFMVGGDGFLVPQKALGPSEKLLAMFYSMRVRPQEAPAVEQVIKTGIPITVSRARLAAMFPQYVISALDLKEVIIVPIVARQRVAGFLAANFASLPDDDRVREIMLGVAGQLGIAYENIRLYEETQNKSLSLAKKMEALKVLHEIDRMILSTLDREEMLSKVALQIKKLVPAEAGAVVMHSGEDNCCHFICGWGIDVEKGSGFSEGECLDMNIFRTRKTVVRGNLHEDERLSKLDLAFISAGMNSDMVVPIISKGTPAGFIRLGSTRVAGFSMEDVEAAEKLTYQIGIALENSMLVSDLEEMLVNVVKVMASAIDAKSPWTKGHSERVTQYAVAIAREMGLGEEEVERLRLASLLHDIGKMGTSDDILNKPGKLTPEEFEAMKQHTERGAEILSHIKQFTDIIPAVRHHHESWDGTGYPSGLKGDRIPLMARIMCIADTFDAITADRPYRPARDKEMAVAEFRRCAGTQFDPKVVEVFMRILSRCEAKKPPFPLQAA